MDAVSMKFSTFEDIMGDMRRGCMNQLSEMSGNSDKEEYNQYAERHNELNAILMSLQVEYYDNETGDN